MKGWKHRKLKIVYIPEANGKKCRLGPPIIRDIAMQCMVKYSLDPVYDSYNFVDS